jgi:hypothetical protein
MRGQTDDIHHLYRMPQPAKFLANMPSRYSAQDGLKILPEVYRQTMGAAECIGDPPDRHAVSVNVANNENNVTPLIKIRPQRPMHADDRSVSLSTERRLFEAVQQMVSGMGQAWRRSANS